MNRATLHTVIGGAVALAVGAAIGAMRPISHTQERADGPAPSETTPRDAANEQLARALKTETGAKRTLLLVAAAEKATAKEMPGILRAAGNDNHAVRMLATHWATLDPKHMFAELYAEYLQPDDTPTALPLRNVLTRALFEQWVKADSAAVLKALSEAPNFRMRHDVQYNVIENLMKTDVETGLRAMHEWNIGSYTPDLESVDAWAARDPRHAAEVVAKYNRGGVAREMLEKIGKAWGASDPGDGMRFAATLPAASRAALGSAVLSGWAEKDLTAAASFTAAQTDPAYRNGLAQGLVGSWGKKDPAAAIGWSQENMQGKARNDAIAGIVSAAAKKDLVTAGELVAGMEAGSAQNHAAASLFEVWFEKGEDQRDAAFVWLAALPDKEASSTAFENVEWDWAWRDPKGMREFISGPRGDLASQGLINRVARDEAAKNPEAALDWTAKLPKDRIADARDNVIHTWLQLRPEAAAAYVSKLPAGPERDRSIRSTVSHLTYGGSPEQAGRWLATLPEADQKAALSQLSGYSADKRQKIKDAMTKPAK